MLSNRQDQTLINIQELYKQRFQSSVEEFAKQEFDLQKVLNQLNKSLQFKNHSKGYYRGGVNGNIRQGFGEWISEDLSLYKVGSWKNDLLQGKGLSLYVIDTNSMLYYELFFGDYYNGKPDGYGILQKSNNQKYEGRWKNGTMNGNGFIYFGNSYVCRGQFENNQLKGEGEIESLDKDNKWKMVGNFEDSNKFKGEIIYKEGRYIGEAAYILNSWQLHGKGKFIWNDGSYYSGSFNQNQRQGYAVSKFGKEDLNELIWKDDQINDVVKYN